MGTMRLVVDGGGRSFPTEVSADELPALLADRENRLWLDISDPGPAEVELLLPQPEDVGRGALDRASSPRRATFWRRCSAASARSRRACAATSPTCRTMRCTC